MIFVTANSCRSQLEGLTQLLVSLFPGSTIYQHTDLCRVPHDALRNHVDAVFLEAGIGKTDSLDFIQMLHRQKASLPVFIIASTEDLRQKAEAAGAYDYLVQPITAQQLKEALQPVQNKEHAS